MSSSLFSSPSSSSHPKRPLTNDVITWEYQQSLKERIYNVGIERIHRFYGSENPDEYNDHLREEKEEEEKEMWKKEENHQKEKEKKKEREEKEQEKNNKEDDDEDWGCAKSKSNKHIEKYRNVMSSSISGSSSNINFNINNNDIYNKINVSNNRQFKVNTISFSPSSLRTPPLPPPSRPVRVMENEYEWVDADGGSKKNNNNNIFEGDLEFIDRIKVKKNTIIEKKKEEKEEEEDRVIVTSNNKIPLPVYTEEKLKECRLYMPRSSIINKDEEEDDDDDEDDESESSEDNIETNEEILLISRMTKENVLLSKERVFVFTSKPQIYYIDPQEKKYKGNIPIERECTAEVRSRTKFVISVPNRKYRLEILDNDITASVWVELYNFFVSQIK